MREEGLHWLQSWQYRTATDPDPETLNSDNSECWITKNYNIVKKQLNAGCYRLLFCRCCLTKGNCFITYVSYCREKMESFSQWFKVQVEGQGFERAVDERLGENKICLKPEKRRPCWRRGAASNIGVFCRQKQNSTEENGQDLVRRPAQDDDLLN